MSSHYCRHCKSMHDASRVCGCPGSVTEEEGRLALLRSVVKPETRGMKDGQARDSEHAAALTASEERCRVLEEALSKIWTAAKVYYTNGRGETYIKDEDLPPVFAQARAALEGE